MSESPDSMDRQLVTVTTITALEPIPKADRLELARVANNSYQCVVGKNEYKVGDKVLFYEIGSFLPPHPAYDGVLAASKKEQNGKAGYRIKTMRFRGALSQGFIQSAAAHELAHLPNGTDVTKHLGVVKWDPPLPAGGFGIGAVKGPFPDFIPKTDQMKVQNLSMAQMFKLFHHPMEVTEKVDGSSCTVFTAWGGEEGFCVN